jgi:ATP-dependent Clp protease ATP-binding subunit ClpC
MIQYSLGVQVAWQIGSYEASYNKSPEIEIDHIMLGILSLEKIHDISKLQPEVNYGSLIDEKERLYNILKSNNIEITVFRRKLRLMLPPGNSVHVENILHRSEDCKKIFSIAACIGNNLIKVNHLFITILNSETSYARILLIRDRIDIEKLKTEIMFSAYRNN